MKYKPHIPNFTLVGQCGQGGSSTVWLAVDRDGIRRAIRILDRQVPENRSRIETETQAIARYRKRVTRHRNLLEILYFGRTEKHLYYITEPAESAAATIPEAKCSAGSNPFWTVWRICTTAASPTAI